MQKKPTLTVASYNVHGFVGSDGAHDTQRIAGVVDSLNAEVVALQEVEITQGESPSALEQLCPTNRWKAIHGPTFVKEKGPYGNALLTQLPVLSVDKLDISEPGREPRGVLSAVLEYHGIPFRVLATHLGLKPAERRAQCKKILGWLAEQPDLEHEMAVTVLLGDLNEWMLWGRPLRWLKRFFGHAPAVPTFPSRFPIFALDRTWVTPREQLVSTRAIKSPLARVASEHLPLISEIRCP